MMMRYAKELTSDLVKDPQYFNKLFNNNPLSPKRLEVHITFANCNYKCKMCLWRVGKNIPKYTSQEIKKGILSINKWNKTLKEAKKLGTEIVIFSGGGEPLLREEIYKSIKFAREYGLKTFIYTNGSQLLNLSNKKSPLYDEILNSDWIRISMHAATNKTYDRLIQLPINQPNLQTVTSGIKRLLQDRSTRNKPLRIGIGFVIQKINYREVESFVKLAYSLGVDFVNIRMDCVDITKKLNEKEHKILINQLKRVRLKYLNGYYKKMFIDFADVLIAPMNDWGYNFTPAPTPNCRVHQYRASINPFGRVAVCDLMAEPYYSKSNFTLGFINKKTYKQIIKDSVNLSFLGNKCSVCMPGQISINAIYRKILEDAKKEIMPQDQYF
jgi:MoaA/NifB/PqqE/SkfB family radical SAM enzyme